MDLPQRIEALEKKLAELEQDLAAEKARGRRAAVQQTFMDDRLIILERNRLFRLWNDLYRRVQGRGALSDLRTPGDYQHWIYLEQQRLITPAITNGPLISVLHEGSSDALANQTYPHREIIHSPAEAKGEFILELHSGDRLAPQALHIYAQAHSLDSDAAVFYCDEDRINREGRRSDPCFKPNWSPALFATTSYVGRGALYRRDIFASSLENTSLRIHHIPHVLYHRAAAQQFSIKPTAPAQGSFTLIVCSRQPEQLRECIAAVQASQSLIAEIIVVHHLESGDCITLPGTTCIPYRGAFNFARMNNLAAAQAKAPHLLFMNDDVIVRAKGWDQALASALAPSDVGAAGAILQYPDGAIQHAGVVIGMGDAAGHCGRFQSTSDLWPWLRMTRDVTAVTGALLGIRKDVFHQLNGFDEAFPVNYNGRPTPCLRIRRAGLRIICADVGEIIHKESQTRIAGTRYQEARSLIRKMGSPTLPARRIYSPHLAPTERITLNLEEQPHPLQGLE